MGSSGGFTTQPQSERGSGSVGRVRGLGSTYKTVSVPVRHGSEETDTDSGVYITHVLFTTTYISDSRLLQFLRELFGDHSS